MFDHLKQRWHRFIQTPPGQRFQAHFQRQQQTRPREWHRKLLAIGGGIVIMGAGIFFMLAPGPGILIFLVGALMVAEESATAARWMDQADARLARWLARWRHRSESKP